MGKSKQARFHHFKKKDIPQPWNPLRGVHPGRVAFDKEKN